MTETDGRFKQNICILVLDHFHLSMKKEDIELLTIIVAATGSLAAAVSAIFSAVSTRTTLRLYRKEKKEKLHDELNRILEIGIEYPYLEADFITTRWKEKRHSGDMKFLRYDMYCNLIFNYIHHVCEHFDYDRSCIEDFVDIKNWIPTHQQNWQYPDHENENIEGYDERFREFVNSYLK